MDMAITKKAAIAATTTPTKPTGHRKLLQGEREVDTDFRQQSAMEGTAGAIAAAASGVSSAGTATAVGTASANSVVQFNDSY